MSFLYIFGIAEGIFTILYCSPVNDASLWQNGYGQSLCGRHDLSHQLHLDIDGPLLDLGGDGDGNLNL